MLNDVYQTHLSRYSLLAQATQRQSTRFGWLRLLAILSSLAGGYIYFDSSSSFGLVLMLTSAFSFIFLINRHQEVKRKVLFFQELVKINRMELEALQGKMISREDGKTYQDTDHPYTHDLDIFGPHSLFHFINRTCTSIGTDRLARRFMLQKKEDIRSEQEAVKELAGLLEWRQHFTAQGQLIDDRPDSINTLQHWLNQSSFFQNKTFYRWLAFIIPAGLIVSGSFYLSTGSSIALQIMNTAFLLNLLFLGLLFKSIKRDYELLAKNSKSLQVYGELLTHIQSQTFASEKLRTLTGPLSSSGQRADEALKSLSGILFRVETMNYGVPALMANGIFLYSIHNMHALERWRKKHGPQVIAWIQCLAEFDALNSLANFAFNAPDFCYPELRSDEGLKAEHIGHPLIPAKKRIGNDISFDEQPFIILTGSNMSGKSTFLRTLGVNLVLAKMGAPVCASRFSFYPYEVFLSMRINDSLQNSESFFYAELKRLKRLIDHLQHQQQVFIMLDEILRGTNSNDKYTGTVGLIQKLVEQKATGIIATHDLMVTQLQQQFPDYIDNQCFEVEIRNEDLYFDYKLKKGVCEKMSASFLLKKMNIIQA